MSTERIRHLARTFMTALAADGASPSLSRSPAPSPAPSSALAPSRSDTGHDVVVETGSAPWTPEMAGPSFMILVAGPRR
ncbi:hypothetical protein [Streptomyces sp. NBC_00503]|uniref:hypothetical protein n=1 Tax=Streptomyces sp. NBC_00503 TaxID=2903659 RepID=UPI002E82172E|nr:hypothetical protein [Streptomyces sp. NBC_00503]WUD83939.1 hypothetical protein OG490_27205 [Streptomyces sp. NBC_00503]